VISLMEVGGREEESLKVPLIKKKKTFQNWEGRVLYPRQHKEKRIS